MSIPLSNICKPWFPLLSTCVERYLFCSFWLQISSETVKRLFQVNSKVDYSLKTCFGLLRVGNLCGFKFVNVFSKMTINIELQYFAMDNFSIGKTGGNKENG
ncbi:uncharacterized protein LOC143180061 [Calliopsis andreniformis]|uniref:uncharacterized protein LOC143180061 n=1 Tax=Calliopsis andreniformis TaxID=337506 RepID=UPI003FCD3AD9